MFEMFWSRILSTMEKIREICNDMPLNQQTHVKIFSHSSFFKGDLLNYFGGETSLDCRFSFSAQSLQCGCGDVVGLNANKVKLGSGLNILIDGDCQTVWPGSTMT